MAKYEEEVETEEGSERLEAIRRYKVRQMVSQPRGQARSKKKDINISIDYGYDNHEMKISAHQWTLIQTGTPLTITGEGFFVEGEIEEDYWAFNEGSKGSLSIDCDSGRQVYEGSIDALIAT